MPQPVNAHADFLEALVAVVGAAGFSTDPKELSPWLRDWRGRVEGKTLAMVSPSSTEQVQQVVRLAGAYSVPIVPQGGNTSMVAGATPDASGASLLLSMRRMRRIRDVSEADNSLIAEAGVILSEVHDAAASVGRLFPLSLGAKGSATVGGLVSTNAGGVQVLRYGTMRALTLGIEAVLADGSRLDGLSTLRKDNRGFDLKQLLIGAEGTLGIVTAASLKLVAAPRTQLTAWVGLRDLADALPLLRQVEAATGGLVTSFEIIPQLAMDLIAKHLSLGPAPLVGRHDWHVLIEVDSARADDQLGKVIEGVLGDALQSGAVADAVIAASTAQAAALWRFRESVPEAERREGGAAKHDVALRVADMPRFIADTAPRIERAFPGSRVLAFGHLGDGNVHFNVGPPSGMEGAAWLSAHVEAINRLVHDAVAEMGGSLSAEHGIGQLKLAEFERLAEPERLRWMRAIKQALDPQALFNPGKLLPPCE